MPSCQNSVEGQHDSKAAHSGQERPAIICPDCQSECQIMGKMENSVYTWCRCNRYIQIYDDLPLEYLMAA